MLRIKPKDLSKYNYTPSDYSKQSLPFIFRKEREARFRLSNLLKESWEITALKERLDCLFLIA